ncbi:DUF6777 domain-containing protein [Streptomyces monashensis]|uniref:DUF6777 domain-containing protein n=1 Tax=Streptomyces monashensis TaxID=1678012 RepID=A0A1S2P0L4_9ACTN|nr:DUF6777 domain-containing protein [Streptomyces monashensis]OIJ86674.1 hypothetical protein BIV23_43765 [Streptomyces monashensis]
MRIPTGSIVAALALSALLLVAGCVRPGDKVARMGVEVYLQPAAAQGPDPFTASTVTEPDPPARPGTTGPTTSPGTAGGTPSASPGAGGVDPAASAASAMPPRAPAVVVPVTPAASAFLGAGVIGPDASVIPQPALPAGPAVLPLRAVRSLSGATPGLYGGTAHVSGCDVERQIAYLGADRDRAGAFARAQGISAPALPGYLRGLAPVLLRADTRVTGHGYRDGQDAAYQAVLQAGTAVLVDDRGMPRLRCACGNPLGPPAPGRGGLGARGLSWPAYRPDQVVAVTPAPRAVASLTIVDVLTRTWIERRIGHDVRRDQVVPAPASSATGLRPADPGHASTTPPAGMPSYSLLPSALSSAAASTGPAAPGRPSAPAGRTAPAPGLVGPQPSPSLGLTLDRPDASDPQYDDGPSSGPDA